MYLALVPLELTGHSRQVVSLLLYISAILFAKEIVTIAVKQVQSMVTEDLRVRLSSSLARHVIERSLNLAKIAKTLGVEKKDGAKIAAS